METKEFVAIETGRSGASFLRSHVPAATQWGDYAVMETAVWHDFLITYGNKRLTLSELTAWRDIKYVGVTTSGIWLRGANLHDVQKVSSTSTKSREYLHVSKVAYGDLRRRGLKWWSQAMEQEGWSLIPPAPLLWNRCGDPTPQETKEYMNLLSKRGWESTIASEAKRFELLRGFCDPSGKLLEISKARHKDSK
jgi:hypothetical protein